MDAVEWGAGHDHTFSQVVDQERRTIHAGGHLTVQGADLVRGTVLLLQRDHRGRVTLDLEDIRTADDAGLQDLEGLRRSVTEEGGELVLLHVPVPGMQRVPAGHVAPPPGRPGT
ncbi:hypothetical protein [Geodermatophilus sp. SYSU D00696]